MSIKKILLKIAGTILIIIGIVGLIVPLMPGWPFVFAGFALMGIKRKQAIKIIKKYLIIKPRIKDNYKLVNPQTPL